MVVANHVDKRSVAKPSVSKDAAEQVKRLRMMMLIRRFEERTYQEYTKPGQRIAWSNGLVRAGFR